MSPKEYDQRKKWKLFLCSDLGRKCLPVKKGVGVWVSCTGAKGGSCKEAREASFSIKVAGVVTQKKTASGQPTECLGKRFGKSGISRDAPPLAGPKGRRCRGSLVIGRGSRFLPRSVERWQRDRVRE